MNTTKIAAHILDDIYTFNCKYEKLLTKHNKQEITNNKFANAQYVLLCKVSYLSEVINTFKAMGYKFVRYEKEMCILADLEERISQTLQQTDLSELSAKEAFLLSTYLTKYEDVLSILNDEFEPLKNSTH